MSLDVRLYRFAGTATLSPELPYEFGREMRSLRLRIGGRPAYLFDEKEDESYSMGYKNLRTRFSIPDLIYSEDSSVERIQEDQAIVGVHGPLKIAYGGDDGFDPDINKFLGTFYEIFPDLPRVAWNVIVPDWEESRAKILEYVPLMQEYDLEQDKRETPKRSPQYASRRLEEFLKTVEWVIAQPDWKSYFFHMDT